MTEHLATKETIDFHTHIFPPWLQDQRARYLDRDVTFRELYSDPRARMATTEDLLEAMDEDGVSTSVALGIGWTDPGLAREANDYVIESVRQHPTRLVGFAGVNPTLGDEAAREADRCARAGLRGVGELHPDQQGVDLGDETAMSPLIEVVRERGLIVTTHSSEPVGHAYPGKGNTRPEVLWRFIQNFPDVKMVCAHWGGGLPFYSLMPEVAGAMSNVYFDTAASPFLYGPRVYSIVAGLVGADRILLGSDFPLMRAARLLRQIEESELPTSQRLSITSGNATALLQV